MGICGGFRPTKMLSKTDFMKYSEKSPDPSLLHLLYSKVFGERGVVISLGDNSLLKKLGKEFLIYSTRGESRILKEKEEDEEAVDPSLPS